MGSETLATGNLDIHCAELGRELAQIPGIEEKTLNVALAVLEEQGPYAMFLYIKAREKEKKDVADQFTAKCAKFLQDVFPKFKDSQDIFESLKSLAEDLDDLLFARELLRNALAYARYHLKAREGAR